MFKHGVQHARNKHVYECTHNDTIVVCIIISYLCEVGPTCSKFEKINLKNTFVRIHISELFSA